MFLDQKYKMKQLGKSRGGFTKFWGIPYPAFSHPQSTLDTKMYQVQLIIQFLISLTVALVTAAAETTKPNKPEATPIYIDRIPGYEDLKPCAVIPLSTLVRNMWGGCGDGSQLTSYSCFCTDSYSRFSWQISTAVVENCGSGEETLATSAVEVFHSYCTYGSQQLTDPRYAVTPSTTSSGKIPFLPHIISRE